MKKYLIVLLLTGCSTVVPVRQPFPQAPEILQQPCKQLKLVEDNVVLSEFTKTVVQNYTEYHQCSNLLSGWQEWYQKQKKIYEELK